MRLFLVEDEKKVASFVARSLREHQHHVDVAENGEKALEMVFGGATYDLILLDVRLPNISGVEVCREIRRAGIETPVLMLTARSLVEQRVEGLDSGADDYLTKPFALAELHARIRALTRRGFRGGAKLHVADLELDRPKRIVRRAGDPISLTLKEFALLELLMLRSPEAANRSEIIEHVWTHGFDTETNIVEVYINRLRRKVDQAYPVKLIHTVRGTGYQLAELAAAS